MNDNPFRKLPSVTQVLQADAVAGLKGFAHEQIVEAIRAEIGDVRQRLTAGEALDGELGAEQLATRTVDRLHRAHRPKLRAVINATGIVLHTNLGRSPLAAEAARAAHDAAAGYLNLELELATGRRSSRQDAVRGWICRLTGAEAATAVNNNAAATVIVLRAVAAGKEVVGPRGQ